MTLSTLDVIARLVGFDTVSHRSNLDCIAFIETFLQNHNVPSIRVPNAVGDKAALFATIGPSDRGGVLLNGHLDVVSVENQAWSRDPFTATLIDRRLYGRGSCDMKGFCGTVLAMVPEMVKARLKTPIHLLFSYDEEISCLGSLPTIARFGTTLPMPVACIVGEPTGMEVVDAQKSLAGFETIVTGMAAHSSMPKLGANAIEAAARLVVELAAIADEMVTRGDPTGRFDPSYTTIQTGLIEGGEAINIVPQRARFVWEVRGVRSTDLDEVPARLAALASNEVIPRLNRHGAAGNVVTREDVRVPELLPDPGSYAETLALRLVERNRTLAVAYGTEAGHFQKGGVPTVICGPGSITQAHGADEYIELSEIEACTGFLRRLISALS